MLASRRCGAKTRSGRPCRSPSVLGRRRCRMHGGAPGSGAPRDNKNALKHGRYTREVLAERKQIRELVRQARKLNPTNQVTLPCWQNNRAIIGHGPKTRRRIGSVVSVLWTRQSTSNWRAPGRWPTVVPIGFPLGPGGRSAQALGARPASHDGDHNDLALLHLIEQLTKSALRIKAAQSKYRFDRYRIISLCQKERFRDTKNLEAA